MRRILINESSLRLLFENIYTVSKDELAQKIKEFNMEMSAKYGNKIWWMNADEEDVLKRKELYAELKKLEDEAKRDELEHRKEMAGRSREEIVKSIINYLKTFGQKGKLPQSDGVLYDYYKEDLPKAYEWAKENGYEEANGIPYLKHVFQTNASSRFIRNKRGLIYVERSIDLDVSQGFDNLQFSSIGECWSWKRNNGRSYCADIEYGNGHSSMNVVICGYVHPSSVDWAETIYTNIYHMKNETEIRMNNNALVEVSYIRVGNEKYNIGGSFLLNASAYKYKR